MAPDSGYYRRVVIILGLLDMTTVEPNHPMAIPKKQSAEPVNNKEGQPD